MQCDHLLTANVRVSIILPFVTLHIRTIALSIYLLLSSLLSLLISAVNCWPVDEKAAYSIFSPDNSANVFSSGFADTSHMRAVGLDPILEGMDVLQDVHLVPHFSHP
jgi:hypothetical protein